MLKRQFSDFGINPVLGIMIIIVTFLGFSIYLFDKSNLAGYIYAAIVLSIVSRYGEINRTDFLKFNLSKQNYYKIRILENILTAFPFILFLAIQREIGPLVALTVLASLATLVSSKKSFSFTLPTPFSNRPFEFIAGFRTSIIALIAAWFITAMAIIYQNFHLGICSLLFIFFICLTFYNEPEDVFYVWIYKLNVNEFLFNKVKTAIIYSTLLSLPVVFALSIFFQSGLLLIATCQLLGYLYLLTMILAKYAAFPQKINLPQGILLIVGITIPPALLAIIPYFYFQSEKRLKAILE